MSDQLRTLAEAEAQLRYGDVKGMALLPSEYVMVGQKVGFIEGFIAGRTSVTRENIADVIYANTEQIDHCGYGLLVVEDPLELADRILEQVGVTPEKKRMC